MLTHSIDGVIDKDLGRSDDERHSSLVAPRASLDDAVDHLRGLLGR